MKQLQIDIRDIASDVLSRSSEIRNRINAYLRLPTGIDYATGFKRAEALVNFGIAKHI